MSAPDFSRARWRKSSRSNSNGTCVEVAFVPDVVGVRDSKNPSGPALVVSPSAFAALIDSIKAGQL